MFRSNGVEPQRPQILGTSYISAHVTKSNQILHGDQTMRGEFYRVDHDPTLAKTFVTRMLTRDIFAGANLISIKWGAGNTD